MPTSKNFELGSFANNVDHDPSTGDTQISNNITLTGELRGPSTFIIDPAGIGDSTGLLQIKGKLQVDGTTTTVNSTTSTLNDAIFHLGDVTSTRTVMAEHTSGTNVITLDSVVGINTAITSVSGGFVGYSFAVPSNVARKVFEDLIEYGDVQKGLLGVVGQALDAQSAARFKVDETEGFYITDLEKGLGADLAGLKSGDIIKSVDGITINKFADLSGYLASKRPGEKV